VRPLGPALATAAVVAGAAWFENPLALSALALGSLLLVLAARPVNRAAIAFALTTGVLVLALNPWISAQGLTTVWQGPRLPVLDSEITVEELSHGVAAALRIVAAALAIAAFVRIADSDLLVRAVSRVAPRSALIASLSAQLLPALERDAAGIAAAARTRGASLRSRSGAATLVPALLAGSLERSLAIAEAMEARGYGGPGRTRAPEPAPSPADRALEALGAAALCVVVVAGLAGWTDYAYYPLTGDPVQAAALAVSGALVVLLAATAGTVRWAR
jgi:energy-coupling factor transport system permease protein